MSVLFFGSYNKDYSRNRILEKGLLRNKIVVYHCNAKGIVIIRYLKLLIYFIKIQSRIKNILVAFPGHADVPLAFILSKLFGKKVFFDIFTSQYETYIEDRRHFSKNSLRGWFYYLVDFISLRCCDYLITDTKEHLMYYQKTFSLKNVRTIVVYLGSDNAIFKPRTLAIKYQGLFYGYFQPLHGTKLLIKAISKLPKKYQFVFIGHGQDKPSVELFTKRNKMSNIIFINSLSLDQLAKAVNQSELIFGIFGDSKKAKSVIPNKVYDAIASKKPFISQETKAIKEIFKNEINCYLQRTRDPKDLAKKIESILKSKNRKTIAEKAYLLYKQNLTSEKVVKPLISYFK